jgi:predicted MPP superfamily phosphohydrolase
LARFLRLEPDAILLGGDLATSSLGEVESILPILGSLEAPLGIFVALGNHDHYTRNAALLRRRVEEAGIRVLHNTSALLTRRGGRLLLAGIDDYLVGEPDLDAALSTARSLDGASPIVLLSHNPDVFFEAARRGVALVLSGHTHGGQMRIPGMGVLVRMSRYRLDEGRYRAGAAQIVVSRGLGVSGMPFRTACPPEGLLVTLRCERRSLAEGLTSVDRVGTGS